MCKIKAVAESSSYAFYISLHIYYLQYLPFLESLYQIRSTLTSHPKPTVLSWRVETNLHHFACIDPYTKRFMLKHVHISSDLSTSVWKLCFALGWTSTLPWRQGWSARCRSLSPKRILFSVWLIHQIVEDTGYYDQIKSRSLMQFDGRRNENVGTSLDPPGL